jgi:hypothetical protein
MYKRLTVLLFAFVLGCASLHKPLPPPDLAGLSIDEAAIACLDWAWMVKHKREVAGGVLMDYDGLKLVCSDLTLGTRAYVVYDIEEDWMVHFHTHTVRGRMSYSDKEQVARLDPMRRPSYMRESSGVVWIYECDSTKEGPDCDERIVNSSNVGFDFKWPW